MTETHSTYGDAPDLFDLFGGFREYRAGFLDGWSSPEALAQHVESHGQRGLWNDIAWTNDDSFFGTSMRGAIECARKGWHEGAEQAQRALSLITPAMPQRKRLVKYGVAGALVNVPRYLAGNPLDMIQAESRASKHRPAITLVSSISANCGVRSAAMMNRAAVVAAIVDATEAQGFACEVISVGSASVNYSTRPQDSEFIASMAVRVKDAGSPLDLARFAFGMGHTALYRRFGFHVWCEHETRALNYCLGFPKSPMLAQVRAAGAFLLPSFDSGLEQKDFRTEQVTAEVGLGHLLASLRAQDCPAFPREEQVA